MKHLNFLLTNFYPESNPSNQVPYAEGYPWLATFPSYMERVPVCLVFFHGKARDEPIRKRLCRALRENCRGKLTIVFRWIEGKHLDGDNHICGQKNHQFSSPHSHVSLIAKWNVQQEDKPLFVLSECQQIQAEAQGPIWPWTWTQPNRGQAFAISIH